MTNDFDRFGDLLDYPVYVVTAAADGDLAGCLVGFASQCSIDPPRFVVWLSVANRTYRVALRCEHLAVHVLDAAGHGLAALFGGRSGDLVDKFEHVAWDPRGAEGTPVLREAAGWFVGRVRGHCPGGDHVGFLLDVVDVGPAAGSRGGLLAFSDVDDVRAGHPA
ncbi:flavin reductase family protein [Streptomyces sp. NPDC093225]|uniref:flavin reductase family protein n=1 Tax=Streptomyces sp. NPDC093225 TaxID=3366034 RepID=UPI00382F5DAB